MRNRMQHPKVKITPIICYLQLVHHYIEGTDIDTTDINTTTILVLLVLVLSNCSTPMCYCLVFQVKVTLRLTVGQSVSLGVKPNQGLLTRDFFFPPMLLCFLCGALSLTRGRVCHLSVLVNKVYSSQYLHKSEVTFSVLDTVQLYNTIYTGPPSVQYSRLCPIYK
jgi:hypothetical protein